MLEMNYKKLYVALYLKQVSFASYMKDGNYIVECKDNVIIISDDNCRKKKLPPEKKVLRRKR